MSQQHHGFKTRPSHALKPTVDPNVFIASNSVLAGNVIVKEGASIWYGAGKKRSQNIFRNLLKKFKFLQVLRGDGGAKIEIGKYSNVQDNAVGHSGANFPLIVGEYVSIGHNACIHGCIIEVQILTK